MLFKRPKTGDAEPQREARDIMYGERTSFERDGKTFYVISGVYKYFWDLVKGEKWENGTFDALRQNITSQSLYIDIGAWIGPTVLYGGSFAKRVIAVEPDPFAMASLIANLDLNEEIRKKTELVSAPVSSKGGPLQMHAEVFGDSQTSMLTSVGKLQLTCMSMACADFLLSSFGTESHVFIKVDIEGAEYDVVPELLKICKSENIPAEFHVSLHGLFRQNTENDMGSWAKNLQDHGRILASLADYGTIHLYDGTAWRPMSAPFGGNFADLAARGGFQTELLVKRREINRS